MTTAYNINSRLFRGRQAGQETRLDPGTGGIVIVSQRDRASLVMNSTGPRTLEAAPGVPLGTKIACFSTAGGASVNGLPINAGQYAEFIVTLDGSGVHQWVPTSSAL